RQSRHSACPRRPTIPHSGRGKRTGASCGRCPERRQPRGETKDQHSLSWLSRIYYSDPDYASVKAPNNQLFVTIAASDARFVGPIAENPLQPGTEREYARVAPMSVWR